MRKSYVAAKNSAQAIIRKKVEQWEREEAENLAALPRREREKEGWRRLKRNLGGSQEHTEVKLMVNNKETTVGKEIVNEVERFWKQIIWKKEDTKPA